MSRLDDIRAGGTTLVLHVNYGNGYGYIHRSIVEPRIAVGHGGPKGRNSKFEAYRKYVVDGCDTVFKTLEEAVLECERQDRAKDDAEWNAAAPKKKRPPALPED